MTGDKSVNFYAYGHDFGNSTTTGVVLLENGRRTSVTIPSTSAPGSLVDLHRIRSGVGKEFKTPAEALKPGEHVLVLGGSERFIGDLAVEQTMNASTRHGDLSRYWSQYSLEHLLTNAATIIDQPTFGLYVVAGMPIETYNATNVKLVKRALEGDSRVHDFTFDGRPRTVFVRVLQVVMEGMGAVIHTGDDSSELKAVIDIGGRTTDLAVFNGDEPIAHLTRGRPIGVEEVAQKVSDGFEAVYDRPLTFAERRDVLYAHARILHRLTVSGELTSASSIGQRKAVLLAHLADIAYPRLFAGTYANPTDLVGWMEKALNEVGQEIRSFVSQTWSSGEKGKVARNIPRVVLVGGGACYWEHHIRSLIPQVVVSRYPEQANAQGYADLAWELARMMQEKQITA